MTKGASKPLLIFAVGASALAGIGGYAWYKSRRPPVLEVYVFDTPGMPSAFIRTPDDKRILIGGGSNADIVRRLTAILPFYSRRIDTIIAPDIDAKNITGLIEVMNRYDVDKVMIPTVILTSFGLASTTDPAYEVFQSTIKERNISSAPIATGDSLSIGLDVTVDILFPVDSGAFKYSKASPPSLVYRIRYGSTSILFMGNATTKIQKFVATSSSTNADVLVVSQSLTPSNFSKELMNSVRPDYLIYSQAIKKSGGKSQALNTANKKANPLAGILGDHRFNIQEKGEVRIVSDGHKLSII